MSNSADERRVSNRTELTYKLTLTSEQNQRLLGTVKNISEKGLHVLTLNDKHEGNDIKLTISLPELLQAIYGQTIEIVASWRWSQPLNDQSDIAFYMAGYEYDINKQEKDARFFIEHVLEGIPDHILEMA